MGVNVSIGQHLYGHLAQPLAVVFGVCRVLDTSVEQGFSFPIFIDPAVLESDNVTNFNAVLNADGAPNPRATSLEIHATVVGQDPLGTVYLACAIRLSDRNIILAGAVIHSLVHGHSGVEPEVLFLREQYPDEKRQ